MNSIKIQTDSILHVPIYNYQQDFTFIVNNERFRTTKIIADLISPNISRNHQIDPSLNEFTIDTKINGNFQLILDLLRFQKMNISEKDIPYFSEIIEKLGTEKIEINICTPEINLDNVFELLVQHEKSKHFYKDQIAKEIDFLSLHFYELNETQQKKLLELETDTVIKIINNHKLSLENEDQLLKFIDQICSENPKYSVLYEYVYFTNVSRDCMMEFVSLFDYEFLTHEMWISLSKRLTKEIKENSENIENPRYMQKKEKGVDIQYSNNKLNGIFNYLKNNSNIKDEVNVTASTISTGSLDQLLDIENSSNYFHTDNKEGSWVCFEFKKHKVNLSGYSIKSSNHEAGNDHLKNWAIEGSSDGNKWTKIDEINNCTYLNGRNYVHTFSIKNYKKNDEGFKFLRIRITGPGCHDNHYLQMCSMELYGQLLN